MNFNSHGDWTREVLSDTDHGGGNKRGGGPSSGNCPESDLPLQGWGVYPAEASPGSSHFSPSRFSSQVPPGFPQNTRTHRDTQIHRHPDKNTPRHTQMHTDMFIDAHVHTLRERNRGTQTSRHTTSQGPPPVTQTLLSLLPPNARVAH